MTSALRDNFFVLVILNYHGVEPAQELTGNIISLRLFRSHLKTLRDLGFKSPLCEIFDGGLFRYPEGEKFVLITFDDGFESVYRYAYPLMEEFGFKGVVFVIARYIGRENMWDIPLGRKWHLSRQQIRELSESGWIIGSHSCSHPDLTRLRPGELREELVASRETLEDITGREVKLFSYPYGRLNETVKLEVSRAGYSYAFRSRRSLKNGHFDPLSIERISLYPIDLNIRRKIETFSPRRSYEILKEKAVGLFSYISAYARHKFPAAGGI